MTPFPFSLQLCGQVECYVYMAKDKKNRDYSIIFAIWIMGCSFLVQVATFPRPWCKGRLMLASMVFESFVCSAAMFRFSALIAEKEGWSWVIGVMVCTT